MHAVAFPAPTGCVIHPAPHTAHATVDALLYCPAAHAVHVLAPVPANVSVTNPAPHTKQPLAPRAPWYCPAVHSVHATVEARLY